MIRWVLGPSFQATQTRVAAPAPDSSGLPVAVMKEAPEVKILGVDADAWTVNLDVAAHDPATHNLSECRVYLVPNGAGRPLDGPAYAASSYPYEGGEIKGTEVGATFQLPLPAATPGDYFGQVVLGIDDGPPPEIVPATS